MKYLAIMKFDPATKGLEKFEEFDTEPEADAHVLKHIENYPDAFVVEGDSKTLSLIYCTVDNVAKTITQDDTKLTQRTHWKNWKSSMALANQSKDGGPTMTREMEEHIRDDHNGVCGTPERQAKYDEKIALRGEKP